MLSSQLFTMSCQMRRMQIPAMNPAFSAAVSRMYAPSEQLVVPLGKGYLASPHIVMQLTETDTGR